MSGQQGVSLAWNTSGGATGYALYLGPASGSYTQRIDVATNTTVTLSGLVTGMTNYFVVTAYDGAGLESPASNEAQFTAPTSQSVVTNNPPSATNPPASIAFTPQPLAITNNGQFVISTAGASNLTWLLQGSTNLTVWSFIYTNQAGQPLSYATAIPQGQAWHYYRAVGVIGSVNPNSIAQAVSNHNFSANAVGYVKINAGRGDTLFANPFDCGNNTVAALLPSPVSGSVLNKYTTGAGYTSNVYSGGQWSMGSMTLKPGEGGFLYNPSRTTEKLVFAGQVLDNTVTNFIPTGYSITSPMIPLPNSLSTFPAVAGDVIQCYAGKWISYTNVAGAWVGSSRYGPLTLQPGGAFFITTQTSVDWTQTYWPND